jgi:hypothetical protein
MVKKRFRNSIRDVKTLPGADIDSDHNLLVAEVQKMFENRKSKWYLENIKSHENHVKEVIGQKFSQIDGVTGSVEDNWGKMKETLFDILNNDY